MSQVDRTLRRSSHRHRAYRCSIRRRYRPLHAAETRLESLWDLLLQGFLEAFAEGDDQLFLLIQLSPYGFKLDHDFGEELFLPPRLLFERFPRIHGCLYPFGDVL